MHRISEPESQRLKEGTWGCGGGAGGRGAYIFQIHTLLHLHFLIMSNYYLSINNYKHSKCYYHLLGSEVLSV